MKIQQVVWFYQGVKVGKKELGSMIFKTDYSKSIHN